MRVGKPTSIHDTDVDGLHLGMALVNFSRDWGTTDDQERLRNARYVYEQNLIANPPQFGHIPVMRRPFSGGPITTSTGTYTNSILDDPYFMAGSSIRNPPRYTDTSNARGPPTRTRRTGMVGSSSTNLPGGSGTSGLLTGLGTSAPAPPLLSNTRVNITNFPSDPSTYPSHTGTLIGESDFTVGTQGPSSTSMSSRRRGKQPSISRSKTVAEGTSPLSLGTATYGPSSPSPYSIAPDSPIIHPTGSLPSDQLFMSSSRRGKLPALPPLPPIGSTTLGGSNFGLPPLGPLPSLSRTTSGRTRHDDSGLGNTTTSSFGGGLKSSTSRKRQPVYSQAVDDDLLGHLDTSRGSTSSNTRAPELRRTISSTNLSAGGFGGMAGLRPLPSLSKGFDYSLTSGLGSMSLDWNSDSNKRSGKGRAGRPTATPSADDLLFPMDGFSDAERTSPGHPSTSYNPDLDTAGPMYAPRTEERGRTRERGRRGSTSGTSGSLLDPSRRRSVGSASALGLGSGLPPLTSSNLSNLGASTSGTSGPSRPAASIPFVPSKPIDIISEKDKVARRIHEDRLAFDDLLNRPHHYGLMDNRNLPLRIPTDEQIVRLKAEGKAWRINRAINLNGWLSDEDIDD